MTGTQDRSFSIGPLLAFWGGPALFLLMMVVDLPVLAGAGGASVAASREACMVLGLAMWMAAWWITEALPLAATSLLPIVVLPMCGIMGAGAAAERYFDDIVALFLGGFCLALAMEKSGLHRQIAGTALRIFGVRPRMVVLGLLAASAVTSMWVSNTATAMAMLPVALTLGGKRDSSASGDGDVRGRFASACVLAVAFGASIGGVGTLIGTPPNAILQAQYSHMFHDRIASGELPELSFGKWMMIGVPVLLLLIPACWAILVRIAPGVPASLPQEDADRLRAALTAREPMTTPQKTVLIVFLLTAFAWITRVEITVGDWTLPLTGWGEWFTDGGSSKSLATDGMVAIAAALVLFALPSPGKPGDRLLTWEYAGGRLPWAALLLFGGGLALSRSFTVSGLDGYLTASFGALADAPAIVLILAVVAGMTVFSEIASNTAAANLAVPLLGALAVAIGVPPLGLMAAGALGASCGYSLPAATPPNTVAIATGSVRTLELAKSGLWLSAVAILVMTAVVMWLLPAML